MRQRRHQPQPARDDDRGGRGRRDPGPARLPRVPRMTSHDTIKQFLATKRPEAIDFLRALVQVPTDTPPGDNAPHAARAAALLEAMGFTVERHPVPEADVARHGLRSITNLVVRHRFGPGPTIALNAHGDVVPPGDGWTRGPYAAQVEQGRMYGRGVAVSKSDFATYAFALAALKQARDAGLALAGT